MHVKYALLSSPHTVEFLETRLLLNVFRTQKILRQLIIQEILYHVYVSTYISLKKITSENTKILGQMLGPNSGSEKYSAQSGRRIEQAPVPSRIPLRSARGVSKEPELHCWERLALWELFISEGGWHVVRNQALESNKPGFRSQLHPLPSCNIK